MADKAGVLVLTGSRHTAIGAPALRKRRWAQAPCKGLFLSRWFPSLFVLVREQMKMANANTQRQRHGYTPAANGAWDRHKLCARVRSIT